MLPARLRKQSLRMREDGFATRLSIFPPAILLADRPRSGAGLLTRQISVQSVEHLRPRRVAGLVAAQTAQGLGLGRGDQVDPPALPRPGVRANPRGAPPRPHPCPWP